jgi:hypothetical protein
VDSAGNVYVADAANGTIRKMTPVGTNWVVSTIAGWAGASGSADGTGSGARFYNPVGVAVDGPGNVYVADTYNNTIRKVTPVGANWVVSTLAGLAGTSGTADGTNSNARFNNPSGVAVDSVGNLYVADAYNSTVRKITPFGSNWAVSTLAGLAGNYGSADGTGTNAQFGIPSAIAVDSAGNVYVPDGAQGGNETIRKITPTGVVSTLAGQAGSFGYADGIGTNARFASLSGVTVDGAGNLYAADTYVNNIRKIAPVGSNWVVSTLAGRVAAGTDDSGSFDGTGTNAQFNSPSGLAVDAAGNVFVADSYNNTVREVTPSAVVSTLAGAPPSQGGKDGTGPSARFHWPEGVAADGAGNVYVADTYNATFRKLTPVGTNWVVSTLAGLPGTGGSTDGTNSDARFSGLFGAAVDSWGNVYAADASTIRKVTPVGTNWVVSTLAGLAWPFTNPQGLAVDNATNFYVADRFTIRKMTPTGTNWVVSALAGLAGTYGSADGTNSDARFNNPMGVAVDNVGNVYVADTANRTIRKITPIGTNWVVRTLAGRAGSNGSADGTGSNAWFSNPYGIAVDGWGNAYVADNQMIRKIAPGGVVSTIAGWAGTLGSGDGTGSDARFYNPRGVAVDGAGNVYVADTYNNTIRKGVFTNYAPAVSLVAYTPPPMNARLTVTLLPPEAGGQWRFPWELGWRNSGTAATNLVAGNYPVELRNVPGYLVISTNFVVAVTNGGTTFVTNQYYPTLPPGGQSGYGSVTVNIWPSAPSGAGWRFVGEVAWRAPGSTATNLLPDIYFIEFEPVGGYSRPAGLAVQVYGGLTTVLTKTYSLAQSRPDGVSFPIPVQTNSISDLTNFPFGFNGQLQTDVGYGSGAAVQANVVLSAAHLVFDDRTLSYVGQAYWYFQREAGWFEPQPLAARGWYVLSGYAAQRTNDLQSGLYGPDQSTPQSRNLDVAALYFLSPVAGGGYGGYLPSDAAPNPWLTGTSQKMLVGYPVDGSLFGDAGIVPGLMYQAGPQPYALSLATDPVANQQVYTASWFLSYPGNSGGPLYVQFNGYYYPAGVYLGTLYNGVQPYASAVRAIDGDVVNLITNAAILGDFGTNNTGGGVITIIPDQNISPSNKGYVELQLAPPAAVQAGAAWRLAGDATYSTAANYVREVSSTNAIVVEFKPINGWNLPTNQAVTVLPQQINSAVAFYTVINPVLLAKRAVGIGIMGTTGTVYRVERRSSLASGTWVPVGTNAIVSNGFNLLLPWPASNGPAAFYRAVWLP